MILSVESDFKPNPPPNGLLHIAQVLNSRLIAPKIKKGHSNDKMGVYVIRIRRLEIAIVCVNFGH